MPSSVSGIKARVRSLFQALTSALALLLWAGTAVGEKTSITHGTLELVADSQWITPGQKFSLGLHFQLQKGWHIYWINPGDSGEPPRVQWQMPSGLSVGEIEWPTPQRLGSSSVADFGYEDAVLLAVPVNADVSIAAQQMVRISATARLLVCSHEMCIPSKADLSLTLPVKSQLPVPNAQTADLFAAARKSLPRPAPSNWKFSVTEAHDSFVLAAKLGRPTGGHQNTDHEITEPFFFPMIESQIANAAQQKLVPLPGGFQLTLRKSDQLVKPIAHLKGVLVFSGESYLIDVPVGKQAAFRGSFEPASPTVQCLYNP